MFPLRPLFFSDMTFSPTRVSSQTCFPSDMTFSPTHVSSQTFVFLRPVSPHLLYWMALRNVICVLRLWRILWCVFEHLTISVYMFVFENLWSVFEYHEYISPDIILCGWLGLKHQLTLTNGFVCLWRHSRIGYACLWRPWRMWYVYIWRPWDLSVF